jgi:signal transduction histidine kinase
MRKNTYFRTCFRLFICFFLERQSRSGFAGMVWGDNVDPLIKSIGLGGAVLLAVLFLIFDNLSQNDPAARAPHVIRHGEIRIVDCRDPADILRAWQPIDLPYWEPWFQSSLKCYQFRTQLADAQIYHDSRPSKLMIYNIGAISRITLNDHVIDAFRHASETVYLNASVAHEIYLPPLLRRSENELVYDGITYQPFLHVGVAVIGNDPTIAQLLSTTNFLVGTMFDGIKILCLMLGFFFLAFRVLFPKERLIGLAGSTMLLWGLYYGLVNIVEYPIDFQRPILITQYTAAALFCFFFIDFTIEIANHNKRFFHFIFRIVIGFFGPCLIMVFPDQKTVVWLNTYWLSGLIFYFNFMLFYCAFYGDLLKKSEGRLLMIQALVMLATVIHDYCLLNGWMGHVRQWISSRFWPDLLFENYYLTLYGIMLVVLVKSSIVINHYRNTRNYRQNEAVRVASALRQSETRLREVIKKQHDIHNIKLIQMERERLLMEIHDGVGSQLISGMLLAQKGGLDRQTILEMFQSCIDDIRVIIDCISMAERANAVEIFAKLLDRLRPRLESLGIALHYRPDMRHSRHHEISDAQCLHASRIIQECIANAIKHARCSAIIVSIRQYQTHLLIVVKDDGGGVAEREFVQFGRGLKNMRKRSRLLGGRIKYQNRDGGFVVILRFRNNTV